MVIMGNGPNNAVASFGPFKGWRGSDGMAIMGNGPNDATALFGPFSQFFLSFFLIFLLLTIKNRYYICYIGLERVMGLAAMKTGPNNTQSVVWAISEFFFFFLIFLLLTITIRYYVCYKGTESVMGAGGNENESRRRFVRHLGYQCNFFFLFFLSRLVV